MSAKRHSAPFLKMFAYSYHECRHCGHEIEVEVEINETDGDLPDNCPECGKVLKADCAALASDAVANLADAAHDAAKE